MCAIEDKDAPIDIVDPLHLYRTELKELFD